MQTKPPQYVSKKNKRVDDSPRKPVTEKLTLHPRNRHRGRYNFAELTKALPALTQYLTANPFDANEQTIDFANPAAVKTLNSALLKHFYGVANWDVPPGYLCPPIPGRADYLHHAADLLAASNNGEIPRGPGVRVLDIGVGANCIYPLIGRHEYGWKFVGSDIDEEAINAAQQMLNTNPGLADLIALQLQPSPQQIFIGILEPDERFDIVICNPPFHASAQEAQAGSMRKWKNLGKSRMGDAKPKLNFGGQGSELWCEGGEVGFVSRMVAESATHKKNVLWFTTLVSKEDNLPAIYEALRKVNASTVETIEMAQGQKKSRIVAWSFLSASEVADWFGLSAK
jgi:23S rRNA (adenine1618-N6)-methyltransferase